MGLTGASVGMNAYDSGLKIRKRHPEDRIIALAGNPNVGKSTVFNELTGLHQHTGNWPGKTVTNAQGYCEKDGHGYILVDIPGTYSLSAHSAEEEVARSFICSKAADAVVVVCDATCLERNLPLVLQILEITTRVVVCVNLIDEAEKKEIKIDCSTLSDALGVPVVATSARSGKGVITILDAAEKLIADNRTSDSEKLVKGSSEDLIRKAEKIYNRCCTSKNSGYTIRERRVDRLLTNRTTGFLAMLLMLSVIFWITIEGANIPSVWLSDVLFSFETPLYAFLTYIGLPAVVADALTAGVWRVLSWVVAVMLPPMAIFFPLFTLLEDLGYLPRVAFNLDRVFKKCNACGKQSLTMCMGFGCNAAGVVGCRIIDSPRERLIAMLTNSFVPCNGRFPALITIITIFFAGTVSGAFESVFATFLLTLLILFGILMTFAASKLLSSTILRGMPSSFTLELPPYRRPQISKVIIRSIFDRTLFVLRRAAAVAAPAGLVIWLMANVTILGETLLFICSSALEPFARLIGLDGVILTAFILGFPANEIVIPIIIMAYTAQGSLTDMTNLASLSELLSSNGWDWITAICVMLFSLMHWPCSTTLMTIRKESQSVRWTLAAFLTPTVFGIIICAAFNFIARLFV